MILFVKHLQKQQKKIKKSKYYVVDTTLISNKGGIDNIGYNIQLPKHKTSKISIISNKNKILDVQLAYWQLQRQL